MLKKLTRRNCIVGMDHTQPTAGAISRDQTLFPMVDLEGELIPVTKSIQENFDRDFHLHVLLRMMVTTT